MDNEELDNELFEEDAEESLEEDEDSENRISFDAEAVDASTYSSDYDLKRQYFDSTEDDVSVFDENAVNTKSVEDFNFNGSSINELLGISEEDSTVLLGFNSFDCDEEDIEEFNDIIGDSQSLMGKIITEGTEIYPPFEYLCQDIFLSLYKIKPQLLPSYRIFSSVSFNRKIMKTFLNTPEFIKIRQHSKGDSFMSGIALERIMTEMLEYVKDLDDTTKTKLEYTEGSKDSANDGECGFNMEDTLVKGLYTVDEVKKLIDENKLGPENDLLDIDNMMGTSITGKFLEETNKNLVKADECIAGFGFGDDKLTGVSKISFENKRKLVEMLNNSTKLRQVADKLGRLKEVATEEQEKKKQKKTASEIDSVTTGDDVQAILPSELAKLSNENLTDQFYADYSEKKLLNYQKVSAATDGKGPVVVCIDTSGSMSGTRELWSKAMALAVLDIAKKEKRDYAAILYSSKANKPIYISAKEFNVDKVIKIAETFDCGGTNFMSPLQEALKIIENNEKYKDADILFISDGDCGVGRDFLDKFNKKKKELGFKCRGVVIDSSGHSSYGSMQEFCDDIIYASDMDLNNPGSAQNRSIFSNI